MSKDSKNTEMKLPDVEFEKLLKSVETSVTRLSEAIKIRIKRGSKEAVELQKVYQKLHEEYTSIIEPKNSRFKVDHTKDYNTLTNKQAREKVAVLIEIKNSIAQCYAEVTNIPLNTLLNPKTKNSQIDTQIDKIDKIFTEPVKPTQEQNPAAISELALGLAASVISTEEMLALSKDAIIKEPETTRLVPNQVVASEPKEPKASVTNEAVVSVAISASTNAKQSDETTKTRLEETIQNVGNDKLTTTERLNSLVTVYERIKKAIEKGLKLVVQIIETLAHCIQCIRECLDLKPINASKHLKDAVECAKKIPQRAASFVATLKNEREQTSGISVRSV